MEESEGTLYKCGDCGQIYHSWDLVQRHLIDNSCRPGQGDVSLSGAESIDDDGCQESIELKVKDGQIMTESDSNADGEFITLTGVESNSLLAKCQTTQGSVGYLVASHSDIANSDSNQIRASESTGPKQVRKKYFRANEKIVHGPLPEDLNEWIIRHDKPNKPFKPIPVATGTKKRKISTKAARVAKLDTSCDVPDRASTDESRFKPQEEIFIELQLEADTTELFMCGHCGAAFKSAVGLLNHEQVHSLRKEIACDVCDKVFGSVEQLRVHRQIHTGKRISALICEVCADEFYSKKELADHLLENHAEEVVNKCTDCTRVFTCSSEYSAHEQTCVKRVKEKRYSCPSCPEKFHRASAFKQHNVKCHTVKPGAQHALVECKLCLSTFNEKNSFHEHTCSAIVSTSSVLNCLKCDDKFIHKIFMQDHMATHSDSVSDLDMNCPVCDEKLIISDAERHLLQLHAWSKITQCDICLDIVNSTKLKSHEALHQSTIKNDGSVTYYCRECGEVFNNDSEVKTHIDSRHAPIKSKSSQCEICMKVFSSKHNLDQHLLIHKNLEDLPFKCTRCTKAFTRRNLLDQHMNMHTGRKPYACLTCLQRFSTTYQLRQHEIIKHAKREKPPFKVKQKEWKCGQCNKLLKSKEGLQSHLRIHTGERPYQCSVCNSAFKRRSEIRQHLYSHTGERPYRCAVCGVGFRYQNNLNAHMMIHSDERPYSCDVCARAFRKKAALEQHILTHNKSAQLTYTGPKIDLKEGNVRLKIVDLKLVGDTVVNHRNELVGIVLPTPNREPQVGAMM